MTRSPRHNIRKVKRISLSLAHPYPIVNGESGSEVELEGPTSPIGLMPRANRALSLMWDRAFPDKLSEAS